MALPPIEKGDSPPRGDELELVVAGETFTGWERIAVTRPLAAVSGTFQLTVAMRRPWPILPGQEVQVRTGDDLLLTGFVDALRGETAKDTRRIEIAGRDRTADLVDCSATESPVEFENRRAFDILEALASPFGIRVVSEIGSPGVSTQINPTLPLFAVQPGETVWAAMERVLRVVGALATTDGQGNLVVTRPGRHHAEFQLREGGAGGNITSAAFRWDLSRRFRHYTVRGQGQGSDQGWGDAVFAVEGSSFDAGIERFRPLLVLAEGQVAGEAAATRAGWEAANRIARSETVEVVVPGWRQQAVEFPRVSALWERNELVRTVIPSLQIDAELLVDQVRYTRDRTLGTQTALRLVRADAYDPQPMVEPTMTAFDKLAGGEEVEFE